MNAKDKLLGIIKNEDKKSPLTDEKISKKLEITREAVTMMRRELGLGDSRERRKQYIYENIKSIEKEKNDISISELTNFLVKMGYKVSKNLVLDIKNEFYEEESLAYSNEKSEDPFEKLIGDNLSLKPSIMQAKASIMYPPFGLPTLIVGESGVGKTYFVECMYKFAQDVGILKADAPYKVLNCADYSDNPQLLISILFGYKKGAFTGAEKEGIGLVEEADNGVLFLDEIHRLPPKGQEILFTLLDRGRYRKLGENSIEKEVNIIFVGATTENIESNLLLTFRRRIPMLINIPALSNRDPIEKLELIYHLFQNECNRINKGIFVEGKIIKSLFMKHYQGNIGQMKSEIQVICANSFMKSIASTSKNINIGLEELLALKIFNESIYEDKKNLHQVFNEIKDIGFLPFKTLKINNKDKKDNNVPINIYNQIEKKYKELKDMEIQDNEINEILSTFIIKECREIDSSINLDSKRDSLNKLVGFVDEEIMSSINELKEDLYKKYGEDQISTNILCYLAIHLEEAVRRIKVNEVVLNSNINKIAKNLKEEYKIALEFCNDLEKKLRIKMPEEEIGYVAMYVSNILRKQEQKKRIGIIIISHGKIASEINNVVKSMLDEHFQVAVDMPLDESPIKTYKKVIDIAKNIDEGKGILFFVDMGSLNNIGEVVEEKYNIKTRTIDRVDLLSVLEAVRKASLDNISLDDLYFGLLRSKYEFLNLTNKKSTKPKALIAVCLTGKGFSVKAEQLLKKKYNNLKTFIMGITDVNFKEKIVNIKNDYEIVAAVGTVNPEIEGVAFIPFNPDMIHDNTRNLDMLINNDEHKDFTSFIDEDLILINPDIHNKFELIELMSTILMNKGYVKKEYVNSVIEREKVTPTFFKGEVAMPHGHPDKVIKSSLIFVKLANPIDWDFGKVDIVCLPALKYSEKQVISDVLKLITNKEALKELRKCKSKNEFVISILKNIKEAEGCSIRR